jgi:glycerophosphoryl diester phosphodiesterase
METWQPIVVAHRGLWFPRYPENSAAAFRFAAEFGFPSECDVHQSSDGEAFVIHDETLERTTSGHGAVAGHTAAELARLRHRYPPGEYDESPPLLSQVADLVAFVEVKPPDAKSLVHRVIEIMGARRWLLQSFDPRNIEHALAVNERLNVALLVDTIDGFAPALSNRWNVHADHSLLDDRQMGTLHDHGLRVGAWTVNTEEEILRILPLRPDVIISDQPYLVRHIVERSGLKLGDM